MSNQRQSSRFPISIFFFKGGFEVDIYIYKYGKSQEIPFDQLIQSQLPYQFKIMNLDEPQFHLFDYCFMKEFHQHLHIFYWPEDVSQRGLDFLDFLEQSGLLHHLVIVYDSFTVYQKVKTYQAQLFCLCSNLGSIPLLDQLQLIAIFFHFERDFQLQAICHRLEDISLIQRDPGSHYLTVKFINGAFERLREPLSNFDYLQPLFFAVNRGLLISHLAVDQINPSSQTVKLVDGELVRINQARFQANFIGEDSFHGQILRFRGQFNRFRSSRD